MNKRKINKTAGGFEKFLAAIILVLVANANPVLAGPISNLNLSLGPASGYSGFFFGNVNAAADVEGRLAVGGNMTQGFDVGYRNPYGSTAPSLVVGGSLTMKNEKGEASGTIYNGPKNSAINTNAGIGPDLYLGKGGVNFGSVVYGVSMSATSNQYQSAKLDPHYLDFIAAKLQLSSLSSQLSELEGIGSFKQENGGVTLKGDGVSDIQVFNLNLTPLKNITLKNVKPGAHVIINSNLTEVDFSGNLGGDKFDSKDGLALHRDTILYNLGKATTVNVGTLLNGSVLAVNANVSGSGHLEGTLIANSLNAGKNGKLELGYEPFIPVINVPPVNQVPEPTVFALLGLGMFGLIVALRSQLHKSKVPA